MVYSKPFNGTSVQFDLGLHSYFIRVPLTWAHIKEI